MKIIHLYNVNAPCTFYNILGIIFVFATFQRYNKTTESRISVLSTNANAAAVFIQKSNAKKSSMTAKSKRYKNGKTLLQIALRIHKNVHHVNDSSNQTTCWVVEISFNLFQFLKKINASKIYKKLKNMHMVHKYFVSKK